MGIKLNIPKQVIDKISPICIRCIERHMKKYGHKFDVPWQCQCTYIPNDYADLIPADKKESMSKKDIDYMISVLDPVTWAKDHIWVVPEEEGIEEGPWTPRFYQEEIIRCTSSLKVLRWGRQLGKSLLESTTYLTSEGETKRAIDAYKEVGEGGLIKLVSFNQETFRAEISDAYITDNGNQPATRIKSATGFDSSTTSNHPYWIWRKDWDSPRWVEAEDLIIGDFVAVPRTLDIVNNTEDTISCDTAAKIASSNTDFVPREIEISSNKVIKKFIEYYWATNGWVSATQVDSEIGCSSASRQFMSQIRMLLLRFGIKSKVYKESDKWKLTIRTSDDIHRFANMFVIPSSYKQESLGDLLCINEGKIESNNDGFLNGIITPDIYWDRVTYVGDLGIKKSYSITVPDNNTLITDGFITHNTEVLAITILHRAYTTARSKQLVLAPQGAHISLIFDRIRKYITESPNLGGEHELSPPGRNVRTPHQEIMLAGNRSRMLAFTAGTKSGAEADSARGQTAGWLYFDEMDRLSDQDINSALPIMIARKNVRVLSCSTPTGKRGYFFNICTNSPMWKESHYTSRANPEWTPFKEALVTADMTEDGIVHEILAEFGEPAAGVFKVKYIEDALKLGNGYTYPCDRRENCVYTMGVDWNDAMNGVRIYIVEWELGPDGYPISVRPVFQERVSRENYTQPYAVMRVVEINRDWNCSAIYIDRGYGSMQTETLQKIGKEAELYPSSTNRADQIFSSDRFKAIRGKESLEVRNPITQQPEKVSYRNFSVSNAIRVMEGKFGTPSIGKDDSLEAALRHFVVIRHTPSGVPVYGMSTNKVADHDLDAWILALLAFTMTQTNIGKPELVSSFSYIKSVMGRTMRTRETDRSFTSTDQNLFVNNEGVPIVDPETINTIVEKNQSGRIDRTGITRYSRNAGWTGNVGRGSNLLSRGRGR